jgi:hypothetical protein
MPYYKICHHRPADVICKCGKIIKHSNMTKHILTTEHIEGLIGRENIEIADHYKY